MNRETTFSPCRKYRYTLWRCTACGSQKCNHWQQLVPFVQFIGLNPSKADENINDPTVRRCINFAASWGYGAMCMTNAFAFRATDPKDMLAESSPWGDENDYWLLQIGLRADKIILAWGNTGFHLNRHGSVIGTMQNHGLGSKLHHLGLTNSNAPKHPLYLKSTLKPIPL